MAQNYPLPNVSKERLAETAMCASFGDQTAEGRSIVTLGERTLGARAPGKTPGAKIIPFTAQSRLSGLDFPDGRVFRKGAASAIQAYIREQGAAVPSELQGLVVSVARQGDTPIVVAEGRSALGVVALSDVLKPGIRGSDLLFH